MEQVETMERVDTRLAKSIEQAEHLATNDADVLTKGGFVLAELAPKKYAYFATATPDGELSDILGANASPQAKIVERYQFKAGQWDKLTQPETQTSGPSG